MSLGRIMVVLALAVTLQTAGPDHVGVDASAFGGGCSPPAGAPSALLNDPHFRAQLWQFSVDTYPLCKVPSGAPGKAAAHVKSMPLSPQAPWHGGSSVRTAGTLPDGTGETAWQALGPVGIDTPWYGVSAGHVEALVVDPTDANTIYAGADDGGVWKSTDGGTTWNPPASTDVTPSVSALAIDPSHPNVLYAGTGNGVFALYGNGILKSTDGGATWSSVGISSFSWVGIRKLAVDPANSNKVWAATDRGLYLSTDGGANWAVVSGIPQTANWDVLIDPADHDTIYDTVAPNFGSASSTDGIYRSIDGGNTWTMLKKAPNGDLTSDGGTAHAGLTQLAFGGSGDTETLYASVEDPVTLKLYGFFRSTDGGDTWSTMTIPDTTGGQYWYDSVLIADPNDSTGKTVWVGGIDLFRSTDAGSTWTKMTDVHGANTQKLHPDQHAFAFAGSSLYVGNDGGVYSTPDSGTTWQNHNATLNITEFYRIATSAANSPALLGGNQDNGTTLRQSGSGSLRWSEVMGGDGGEAAIDFTNPNTMYQEYTGLDMNKTTNGGSNWNSITGGIADRNNACWIGPFVMDETGAQHLISGTREVYETTNGGSSWTVKSGDLTGAAGCISSLAIARTASSTFYAGTSNGKVWVTVNDGATWTDITSGLPGGNATSIAVDPNNSRIAYVTIGQCFYGGCVWRTANGGATWTDITSNLPNDNANSVVVDPIDPQHLYVGTDLGVFETSSSGASWTRLASGIPNATVNDLDLNHIGTILTVGTYGRGAYQLFRSWVRLSTGSGRARSYLAVTGHGFQAGEQVSVTMGNRVLRSGHAGNAGNAQVVVQVPVVPRGSYAVQMSGVQSGRKGQRSFKVL